MLSLYFSLKQKQRAPPPFLCLNNINPRRLRKANILERVFGQGVRHTWLKISLLCTVIRFLQVSFPDFQFPYLKVDTTIDKHPSWLKKTVMLHAWCCTCPFLSLDICQTLLPVFPCGSCAFGSCTLTSCPFRRKVDKRGRPWGQNALTWPC